MTIYSEHRDQRYGLDCWETADTDRETDEEFFSNESLELVVEANRLIANRAFQVIDLCELRDGDEWYQITRFSLPT